MKNKKKKRIYVEKKKPTFEQEKKFIVPSLNLIYYSASGYCGSNSGRYWRSMSRLIRNKNVTKKKGEKNEKIEGIRKMCFEM